MTVEISQNTRTALVTGATGFIGTRLVKMLQESGYNVRVYSRSAHNNKKGLIVKPSEWVVGELDDPVQLHNATRGVDVVFHTAGIASSTSGRRNKVLRINTSGTQNIYKASVRNDVKKFFYFSSILATESISTPYVQSKIASEQFLSDEGLYHGNTQTVILRSANVYGIGMGGSLKTLIRLISSGYLPALPELYFPLSMVSVKDLCRVALTIADDDLVSDRVQIYSVTDGEKYSPKRIEAAIYSCIGRKKPNWVIPRAVFEFVAVLAQAVNLLGVRESQLGLRLYRSLFNKKAHKKAYKQALQEPSFNFAPTATIESEMEQIIESLGAKRD